MLKQASPQFQPSHLQLCLSGIGRAIALQYAQRGAKVFIVGLRQAEVDKVYSECASLHPGEGNVIARVANFTDVQDMVDIRNTLKNCTWLLGHNAHE